MGGGVTRGSLHSRRPGEISTLATRIFFSPLSRSALSTFFRQPAGQALANPTSILLLTEAAQRVSMTTATKTFVNHETFKNKLERQTLIADKSS